MLMLLQGITLLLYPVISSRRNLVPVSFKYVYNFFDKTWWCNNLKSNLKSPRIELPKRGVGLNYTLLNRYNDADNVSV